MTARAIALAETEAADGRFLFQVLDESGDPVTNLVLGDLWIARNGDATYTQAGGTLTAITLNSNNVGTYRYVPSTAEKSVLGQALLMVSKTGVFLAPVEFQITATKGVITEPTIGPIDLVRTAGGAINSTTQVTLSTNALTDLNEYDGAEFRVLAGTNRGVVRSILKAENPGGNIVLTLDAALPQACNNTSNYVIVNRWTRGMTAEQISSLFREWREGFPPAAGIPFQMRLENGLPATGVTVTIQRRLNNGGYTNATNSLATELSHGEYRWDPSIGEWQAGIVTFRATATGCIPYTAWFVVLPANVEV